MRKIVRRTGRVVARPVVRAYNSPWMDNWFTRFVNWGYLNLLNVALMAYGLAYVVVFSLAMLGKTSGVELLVWSPGLWFFLMGTLGKTNLNVMNRLSTNEMETYVEKGTGRRMYANCSPYEYFVSCKKLLSSSEIMNFYRRCSKDEKALFPKGLVEAFLMPLTMDERGELNLAGTEICEQIQASRSIIADAKQVELKRGREDRLTAIRVMMEEQAKALKTDNETVKQKMLEQSI